MKKPARNLVVGVVLVIVLAYGAAASYMMIREESLVFVASGRPAMVLSDSLLAPWDSLRVEASDSVSVFLLQCPLEAEEGSLWAIYLHGAGGQLGDRGTSGRVGLLRAAGFNVLAVEYRGYGHSGSGSPSEAGLYADARAAWDYLVEVKHVEASNILVYGYSLGGMVATHLASQVSPRALVTEGTGTSAPDIGRVQYPWLPAGWIMKNRFDNLSRAPELAMPWLLLHGESDTTVPVAHAEALAGASPNSRVGRLDGGHSAVTADPDGGQRELERFVEEVFPNGIPRLSGSNRTER